MPSTTSEALLGEIVKERVGAEGVLGNDRRRRGGHDLKPGGEVERAAPEMGRELDAVALGQRRDPHGLGDAACNGEIGLEVIQGLMLQQLAEVETGELALAGGDGDVARGPHGRHAGSVVDIHRFLEPGEAAALDEPHEAKRLLDRERAVGVHHDLDIAAQMGARGPDPAYRGDDVAVARADPHLHRAEAAARDVAFQLRADGLGRRPAAGGVGRHGIPALATEQLPHRHIQGAAQDVPAGHVDGADGADPAAAAVQRREGLAACQRKVGAAAVIADLPQPAWVARVLADQRRAQVAVDQRSHRRVVAHAADRGLRLAPAHEAALGLDPHDGGVEEVGDAEIALVLLCLGDRHMHPTRRDVLDLHRPFVPR